MSSLVSDRRAVLVRVGGHAIAVRPGVRVQKAVRRRKGLPVQHAQHQQSNTRTELSTLALFTLAGSSSHQRPHTGRYARTHIDLRAASRLSTPWRMLDVHKHCARTGHRARSPSISHCLAGYGGAARSSCNRDEKTHLLESYADACPCEWQAGPPNATSTGRL